MWDTIKLKSVTSYRSHPRLKAKDRVTVVVDMPIEEYSAFRRQVEAPGSFDDRRVDDDRRADDEAPRPTKTPERRSHKVVAKNLKEYPGRYWDPSYLNPSK